MNTQSNPSVMIVNRSMPPGTIIPELVYADMNRAVAWLCQTFGFRERLRIANHRAQLALGEASLVVVQQGEQALQPRGGEATHSLMVRVADVDRHYEHVEQGGAHIVRPPQTYPFGERQYTVEDIGGHRWTFSESVADVAPEVWGGQPASS